MGAAATRDSKVRYVDESGAVEVITTEALDLKRAARSMPPRRIPPGAWTPQDPSPHWWTAMAGAVPHGRLGNPDRLWVAVFDPVERWFVARPLRSLHGGPGPEMTVHSSRVADRPSLANEPLVRVACSGLGGVAESVRGHAFCLGTSWVGSLVHAAAGGLGALGRRVRRVRSAGSARSVCGCQTARGGPGS